MKLIVGLGNPGTEYAQTRHNAGFMVVDALAARHRIAGGRCNFHGLVADGSIAGEKCVLLKPMTYMNRSGLAVGEAAAFYKVEPQDLLIVVDDTALPAGRIRLRPEGSDGGHNGLKDIERALGTSAYPRLRVGIDAPHASEAQKSHVLGRVSEAQRKAVDDAIALACDAIETWIRLGISAAMNRYNAAGVVEQ